LVKNSLDFITNPSSVLVKDAMAFRKARNELINSNIANIDTPFYKSRDIRFEAHLSKKAQDIYNHNESKILQLARSTSGHIQSQDLSSPQGSYVFFRDGHMVRNDGNNVDLDTETTEMAKNSSAYKALVALAKKQSGMFKYAIESSSKLA
jgi:flagellar basal-body rod protein FlgB